ncbi:EcoAI/FtnUII family type I restriction enzme subunit R [Candidatus Spongiihabitans sp.]|uniref:EcoAI/FtnUII family type I restriction enzme subunit R n=1 Tax=Candidatus Spongiihabitans sp. TaxID=3101308 RepID=UPI003C6ED4EC
MRNEAQTRLDLIDPALKAAGWGVTDGSRIQVEVITLGRLQGTGSRAKQEKADYVLVYKNQKLAVIEAKRERAPVTDGLGQAKNYAQKLQTPFAYATNGHGIYRVDMRSGEEGDVADYPTPCELWEAAYGESEAQERHWRERFSAVPFNDKGGQWQPRYYQHNAITRTLDAIATGQDRILLTLATGTGKTAIAFQVAWKLFHACWNLTDWRNGLEEGQEPRRRPRILFLADRNILADQAFNEFNAFPEDALVRIAPDVIRKKGSMPKNGSVFFTIFQTFMSGRDAEGKPNPSFGDYQPDFFDFIVIDECHRGGANDESAWRAIMDYFASAVQLGLTATPKRTNNVDTYTYFGEPVYTYSLKDGVNDGYLTPFKVKQIATTIDDYVYTQDDDVVEGEVEKGRCYTEADFNRSIKIEEREKKRVDIFMHDINQREKTLVFCANQKHALLIRDLINQTTTSADPNYCVRVTADEGGRGDQYLRTFRDNEKTIPTVLTTSHKLSTGVDARNVRNIVLLRPINSIIEFKQIVGRGTRLFDGKDYFTIYDFVKAYEHFSDPEWDGEPEEPELCERCGNIPCTCVVQPPSICPVCGQTPCVCEPTICPNCEQSPCVCNKREWVKIKLADGKERAIQHMMATSFWNPDGTPMSAAQFIARLFGDLPALFKNEDELRKQWGRPDTRRQLLEGLSEKGYGTEQLAELTRLVNAEKSDLYDVLAYIAYALPAISRKQRVDTRKAAILANYGYKQREFLEFVLGHYIKQGVGELDDRKLPDLLHLKYNSVHDAIAELGISADEIRNVFIGFQPHLYRPQEVA